jgi:hypothetical protein
MVEFIAPYTFTQRGTTGNIALSLLYTFQFTVTYALGFSVFTSILTTDFMTVSLSLQITLEVFFAQPDFFLTIFSQLPSTAISKTRASSRQQLNQINYSSTELSQVLITDSS